MYRKRRRVQSFYGTSKSRFSFGFKVILVAVALLAVVSAVITSAILGKSAEKSGLAAYGRHNLTDFGGVKQPAEDYAAIRNVRAEYANSVGFDKAAFKKEVSGAEGGNAVAFKVNDGEGNLFFAPTLSAKTVTAFNVMSSLSAEDAVKAVADSGNISVAYFNSSALDEADEGLRIMKTAEEVALVSELCSAGLDEIMLFDLPDDSDKCAYVTSFLSWLETVSRRTNICVVLSKEDVEGSGATRVINATEGYADAYAIDLSKVSNANLGNMIERCAYFITQYNARLIVADSENETMTETLSILESYGIKSYAFVG